LLLQQSASVLQASPFVAQEGVSQNGSVAHAGSEQSAPFAQSLSTPSLQTSAPVAQSIAQLTQLSPESHVPSPQQ
jgi:hypothetical protein